MSDGLLVATAWTCSWLPFMITAWIAATWALDGLVPPPEPAPVPVGAAVAPVEGKTAGVD